MDSIHTFKHVCLSVCQGILLKLNKHGVMFVLFVQASLQHGFTFLFDGHFQNQTSAVYLFSSHYSEREFLYVQ